MPHEDTTARKQKLRFDKAKLCCDKPKLCCNKPKLCFDKPKLRFNKLWRKRRLQGFVLALMVALVTAAVQPAQAASENVGLGVAVGTAYSPTHVFKDNVLEPVGNSFSWGFFVDIPLVETFYVAPAAMLYKLDMGLGPKPVTDIDLNFKFVLPLGPLHLAPGVLVGLSSAEDKYLLHVGGLAYVSFNLVANMDVFVLAQYKRLFRDTTSLDDLHGYAGLMFRF